MQLIPFASAELNCTDSSQPLFAVRVAAGFPSPAEDYVEQELDLNQHLVRHPSATYFARADGDSLLELGIRQGDLLIVSRALKPLDGQVVVVSIDGELCCKVLDLNAGLLRPANPDYPAITINESSQIDIEGVVTHAVHYLPGSVA